MDGFLLVNKPKGMTSQTVCSKIRRAYKASKCGHNGTLDPETDGVMVVALDRATKMLNYLNSDDKIYEATIVFGILTDTYDVFGTILEDIKMDINMTNLKEKLAILVNTTSQYPPLTSAIKVNGRKLLEYQRKNIDVEIKPRDIKIYDAKILSDLIYIDDHFEFKIRLHVSKGFYVRSFAYDLGRLLGGYASLKNLKRIASGRINIEQTIFLEDILNDLPTPLPIYQMFKYPIVEINERLLKFVENGVKLYPRNLYLDCNIKNIDNLERFYVCYQGKYIAIYEKDIDSNYRLIFKF